jgi:sigma-B regulation protein RsbU (phosphoserine phosphatase)
MSFRVLHVEDDEARRNLSRRLGRQLKDEDYVYRRVGRLSEALAALVEGCVDVVVLDLTLEDSTGIGTIRSIVEKCPATPVVVLTGEESLGIAKDAIKAGADCTCARSSSERFPWSS